MAKEISEVPSSEERYLAEPTTGEEYYHRGWQNYVQKEFYRAEDNFRKAVQLSPDHPDVVYALGLSLNALKKYGEALQAFQRTVELLVNVPPELSDRATILSRLATGHINRIKKGEWDLGEHGTGVEKEP